MINRKLTVALTVLTNACYGWRTETAPTPETAEKAARRTGIESVRVRLRDGRELDLRSPSIAGDSLIGYSRDLRADYARHAFAVKDIHSISTYGFDGARTGTAVLVGVGASVALVAACLSSLQV